MPPTPGLLKCNPRTSRAQRSCLDIPDGLRDGVWISVLSNCYNTSQVKFCDLHSHDESSYMVECPNVKDHYCLMHQHLPCQWATFEKKIPKNTSPSGEIRKIIEAEMFPEESDQIERYIGGLPDMILGSVKASKSKTMQEVIEFTTELMEDKTKPMWNAKHGSGRPYAAGNELTGDTTRTVDLGVLSETITTMGLALQAIAHKDNQEDCPQFEEQTTIGVNRMEMPSHRQRIYVGGKNIQGQTRTTMSIRMCLVGKIPCRYVCAEKIVRNSFWRRNFNQSRGDGSSNKHGTRLSIISCTKAQEYLAKGCHVFLANITATKDEDKSKGKRLEDVPVVREFPEVFPEENLTPGIPLHSTSGI
ncbi:hypothetical protein Tco_1122115 [Tanacetum coccineum]|uniref:Reverse transcriptase domain-containing protein n=1 Tax=Tanacetum coccineum TaxID=301880 RepID=A0ABQ5IZN7_9ASTR